MMMNALNKTLLSVSVALGLSACASVKTADTYDLDFSKQKYTEQSIEVNGQALKPHRFSCPTKSAAICLPNRASLL